MILHVVSFNSSCWQYRSKVPRAKLLPDPQLVLYGDTLTLQPMTLKIIRAFVGHLSEWNTTCTATSLKKFNEAAILIFLHWMSTIIDKKVALEETNRTQSLFYDQEENTIFTPEQSKYIKPVDIATASLIPEGGLHVNTSLKKLFVTNKAEQQNDTF